jgi:CRP-like cAMP-binding protein
MLNRLHDPLQLLRHKIESIVDLTEDDHRALNELPIRLIELGANQDIVRQADKSLQSCLLMRGLACSSKIVADGRRQIVAFHLPGDMPDLQSLHLGIIDTTVTTLTPAAVGIVLHEHLRQLFDRRRLATALWRYLVTDAAVSREWVANVGQREGVSRTAHLMCELITRMHAIGAVDGDSFDLPVTQQELADALGMSSVHVNRCLQVLRKLGLIAFAGGTLSVVNQEGLERIGDFSDDYLHLRLRSAF